MATVPVRDEVYRAQRERIGDFTFDRSVAGVFDDMVTRSVPFYTEMQRMIVELARDFATPGSSVYDLGCSTGTTFVEHDPYLDPRCASWASTTRTRCWTSAAANCAPRASTRELDLRCRDLNEGADIQDASVVTLVLTLQFIRPLHRNRLMADVVSRLAAAGLPDPGRESAGRGVAVQPAVHQVLLRPEAARGYSDTEIAQKREALENVLIPYKLQENRKLLLRQRASAKSTCSSSGTTSAGSWPSSDDRAMLITIGNFLFRYRNALFPLTFVLLLLPGPDLFADPLQAALLGALVAALGQLVRALTIGLDYIVRGGRRGKVYADGPGDHGHLRAYAQSHVCGQHHHRGRAGDGLELAGRHCCVTVPLVVFRLHRDRRGRRELPARQVRRRLRRVLPRRAALAAAPGASLEYLLGRDVSLAAGHRQGIRNPGGMDCSTMWRDALQRMDQTAAGTRATSGARRAAGDRRHIRPLAAGAPAQENQGPASRLTARFRQESRGRRTSKPRVPATEAARAAGTAR